MQQFSLTTPQGRILLLMRPTPTLAEPLWGELAPLRDTPWGSLLPVISGEALSHAHYGFFGPLLSQIGRPPEACIKLLPEREKLCEDRKNCIVAGPNCKPGPKMPLCFRASLYEASLVAVAWKEGRYVVLVEGEEHSIQRLR